MKKTSGFEKFFKGKEKSGAAKREELRQDKRQSRKEREEDIAAHKRQKRAQKREGFSARPQSFKPDRPAAPGKKREDERQGKPSFSVEKRKKEHKPYESKSGRPKQGDHSRRPFPNNRLQSGPGGINKDAGKDRYPAKPAGRKSFTVGKRPAQQTERKEPFASAPKRRPDDRPATKPALVKKNTVKPKIGAGRGPAGTKPAVPSSAASDEQMPLNKFIAHSGICSRRDAAEMVKGGKVKVNGNLILEPGHKVLPTDDVSVAGKHLKPVKDFIYILLNKPKDYITTTEDPQERKTVLDLLGGAPQTRIYPVGRLDRNTSGVLLLTNDGDLSQKLTHPSNEIKKVYAVTLDKPLTKHHFEEILNGVTLDDGPATVDVLAFTDAKDHTQLGVELHSGRNRIVRRIFEHFGYDIKALDRVVFAGLTKKNVNRGKWRFLTEREVRDLKFFKKGR